MNHRLDAVREALARAEAASLIVTHPPNIRWLSGFRGSAGTLVVTNATATLVTDSRYGERAPEEIRAAGGRFDVVLASGGGASTITGLLDDGTVLLEGDHVSMNDAVRWTERIGPRVRASTGLIEGLRAVKDGDEIESIRRAAAIADASLADLLAGRLTGMSEREVASGLEQRMRERGADEPAFDTIVASGPNSSRPHHEPGTRRIGPGDLVIIDLGARLDGYRSDMTRTFVVGPPTVDQQRMLDEVMTAQARGVASAVVGTALSAVDAACRSHLEAAGFGEAFSHGTGHGVGLDIHEAPAVNSRATGTLCAGHVITVEPGVYVPGIGGVRWEDTVVITDAGPETVTHSPKAPILAP